MHGLDEDLAVARLDGLRLGSNAVQTETYGAFTLHYLSDVAAKAAASGEIFGIWEGPFYKGGGFLSAPPTFGSAGAPVVGDLGEISFAPTASVGGFIVDDDSFDGYLLNLTAGQTYIFSVYGSGATPLEDTVLYVFGPDGPDADSFLDFIDLDDDGGAGRMSLYTFTATESGAHGVAVSNFPGLGQLSGGYTLDIAVKPATDVATAASPEAVTEGVTYGYIDGGPIGGFSEIDWYTIEAQAGLVYTIEVAGGHDYATNFANLPAGELDTQLFLFDPNGAQIGFNDDISFPNDTSSRVGFVAEEAGTYTFAVRAYPNLTTGNPQPGGFSVTVTTADPADFDPLDSIDWNSANNVPFDNGVAYVYFGDSDENFNQTADNGIDPMITIDWNDYEKQQVMLALEEYTRILGVEYVVTDDVDQATFRLLKTESQQYGAYMFPQDPAFGDNQGIAVFNVLSGRWSFDQQQSLEKGGFAHAVILHEFGHGHGLAHPHDTGGGSEVMLGVAAPTGSLGLYDLNQGVYTVMSYNDAWETHPAGPTPYPTVLDNGWSGTLGAFDIAQLQERYGIINPHNTGDTIYSLQGEQTNGTYYETIWDTGGEDTIRFDGLKAVQIDLLAATLDYSPTGGGVVSFVDGVWGGFTIANGVEIENAMGGSGNDVLLGNELGNEIDGRNGNDYADGRAGDDTIYGGNGGDDLNGGDDNDRLHGENGDDGLYGGAGEDSLYGANGDDVLNGGAGDDFMRGGKGSDIFEFTDLGGVDEIDDFKSGPDSIDVSGLGINAWIGGDAFNNVAGELRGYASGSDFVVEGDVDGDGLADFSIIVNTAVGAGDFIFA